jgi:hypothetical protein
VTRPFSDKETTRILLYWIQAIEALDAAERGSRKKAMHSLIGPALPRTRGLPRNDIYHPPATREGNSLHSLREKDTGRLAVPMALARKPWGETAAVFGCGRAQIEQ